MFSTASGLSVPAERLLSARAARVAWGLRGLTGRRQAVCRVVRVAPDVSLVEKENRESGERHLCIRGLSTCGSVWSCPMCAERIVSRRARDITAAVTQHGSALVTMVTCTLRHRRGNSLRLLHAVLARAWGDMWSGGRGQRLRAVLGVTGHVRAAEQTWGTDNGWHPHLHALLFTSRKLEFEAERLLAEHWARRVHKVLLRALDLALEATRGNATAVERLQKLLGKRVCLELGDKLSLSLARLSPLPNDHGLRCSPVSDGGYIEKLGLEVAAVTAKRGEAEHLTSWEIASLAADGCKRARRLWREHYAAMFGRRQLTWSRGLRDMVGLGVDVPDVALGADDETVAADDERLLGTVRAETWDELTRDRAQCVVADLCGEYSEGTMLDLPWVTPAPQTRSPVTVPMFRAVPRGRPEPLPDELIRERAKRMAQAVRIAAERSEKREQWSPGSLGDRVERLDDVRHKLFDLGLYTRPVVAG